MLRSRTVGVTMSKENPWVLKPWHMRVAFRKCGVIVPEDAIELPPKEIKGPDMNIQGKEFYVIVTVWFFFFFSYNSGDVHVYHFRLTTLKK